MGQRALGGHGPAQHEQCNHILLVGQHMLTDVKLSGKLRVLRIADSVPVHPYVHGGRDGTYPKEDRPIGRTPWNEY
eukprot:scaffold181434_cov31-Tisochrysis_lutea.AAC.1